MDPFGQNGDLNEDFNVSGNANEKSLALLPKKKITLIICFIILFLATIGILVLVFFLLSNNESSNSDNSKKNPTIYEDKNEIICKYSISDIDSNTPLLSDQFENIDNSIIDIYINDKKINYAKNYKFSSAGTYNITYILNDKVVMDNMFKDIKNIISIESMKVKNDSSAKIISAKSAFEGCSNLKEITLNDTFDTSELKSTSKMFYNSGLEEINFNHFNTKNVENMSYMFGDCKSLTFLNIENLDTSNVKDMSYMFDNCESLTKLNLNNFNTKNVENMSHMFSNLYNITTIFMVNFNTEKVQKMDYMFYNNYLLETIIIDNMKTGNVLTMNGMFYNCYNLKYFSTLGFNTEQVTDFSYMFKNCLQLKELDLTSFNTVNCNKFDEMLAGCNSMTVTIKENIDDYENLLEEILNSDVNIRFLASY